MSALLEILLRARDEMTPALKNAVREVERLDDATTKAGSGLSKFGERVDSVGRQGRIGLSSAGQAAQLLGMDIGKVVGPASAAADAIGDMAGAGAALGPIGIAVGALVVGFGILNSVMEAQNQKLADLYLRTDAWAQSLQRAGVVTGEVAVKLNELAAAQARVQTGWSFQPGDIAQNVALNNPAIMSAIAGLHALGVEIKDLTPGLETSAEQAARLKTEIENLTFGATSGYDALEKLRASSDFAASSAYQHAAAEAARKKDMEEASAAAMNEALQIGNLNAAFALMRFGENYPDAFMRSAHAGNAMNQVAQRGGVITNALNEAQTRLAEGGLAKAAAAAQVAAQKLRGLVESALNATTVEQRLQMAGDAWDEFRLRLEAVATGTDPSQYGAEFVAQMNALGMSAGQAAAAFKDFSLFSDPANIKLVNFGPIVAEVQHQLDMMIGKANLTSAAMAEVWKNLSPQQKAALGSQGIDNVTDAVTALINPAQLAEQNVSELGSAVKAVPKAVTTTFTVKKDDLFDDTLKDILDAISMIPTDITVNVSLANGIPTADGGTTSPTTPEIPKYADGGYVPNTGLAILHAGEYVLPRAQVQGRAPSSNYFGGVTISGNTFVIRRDADIDRIANALARRWGRSAALRSAMRI